MKNNRKYLIIIGVIVSLFIGYFIVDNILFDGVRPISIKENGVQANYFVKNTTKKKAATVVLIGGGVWGDYWGNEFANQGYVGLSLPYVQREGLPKLPEAIDLVYFEKALEWLKKQPEVDSDKIIVMGASRNAELSLVIASTFPTLVKGAIAYAPSAVSWSNTVLPYNSDELKPSWTYQGKDIPFVPMDKISGNDSGEIETLEYWKSGLAKIESVVQASIRVEEINGPILLFSGKDDKIWPSSPMADMIEQRVKESGFNYSFQNVQYEDAGHLISSNPESNSEARTGKMSIGGKEHSFEFGGTNDGDFIAKQDAKMKVLDFLKEF